MYGRRSPDASPHSLRARDKRAGLKTDHSLALIGYFQQSWGRYVGREQGDRMLAHISADAAVCCVHVRSINLSNVPQLAGLFHGPNVALCSPQPFAAVCRAHASNASQLL
jgi:hypothetical protein